MSEARVRDLVEKLRHQDAAIRRDAAWELGAMRSKAEAAIPQLGAAVGDRDQSVHRAASLALFRIGRAAMESQSWMRKIGAEPITADVAAKTFDKLWETVDQEYTMFVIRPAVNWDALRAAYRPEALAARSDTELALIVADMLSHLRDLHVWLKIRGHGVPLYSRRYPRNWNGNTSIYEQLVGTSHFVGKKLFWAKTSDKIGWIAILGWSDADSPDQFDEALEEMRDTRGLIVDVRCNGGGDSVLASMVAARFADRPRTYMYYRYRTGPKHTDLTAKIPRNLIPRGPWRYNRPVVLLQGRKCVSANESFCAQMAACPNVTTMGGPTKGSTGSPIWFQVGSGIEVAIPQWIAYLPDGEVFDEKGVPPDTLFEYRSDAFSGQKDELMSMALRRLRQEPLPSQSIAGPSIREVRVRNAAERVYCPKVIAVGPLAGSVNVNPRTELRVRFDRPMHPSTTSLGWKSGELLNSDRVRYDGETNEFVFSVSLQPGCTHRIVVNPEEENAERGGFKSVHGKPAGNYEWTFTTGGSSAGDTVKRVPSAEALPVRSVINEFNRRRSMMRTFVETVDTMECSEPGPTGFRRLRTYSALFDIQGPQDYLADVSDFCGRPTVIFGSGTMHHVCGYYQQDGKNPTAVASRSEELSRQDIRIADPFESCSSDAETVCERMKLKYGGTADLDSRRCHILESYFDAVSAQAGPSCQWWIDAESYLLVRVVKNDNKGVRRVARLSFDSVNEPRAHMDVVPGLPYQMLYRHRKMAEPLNNDLAGRFVKINDGCRGSICARWGRYGPDGEQYVGL